MSQKDKTIILLSGVNEQVRESLQKAGIDMQIGEEKICSNIGEAITLATQIINRNKNVHKI